MERRTALAGGAEINSGGLSDWMSRLSGLSSPPTLADAPLSVKAGAANVGDSQRRAQKSSCWSGRALTEAAHAHVTNDSVTNDR